MHSKDMQSSFFLHTVLDLGLAVTDHQTEKFGDVGSDSDVWVEAKYLVQSAVFLSVHLSKFPKTTAV